MDLTRLTAYVDSLASVGVPGCDLAVFRDHEPVYRHAAGFSDAGGTRPMTGGETYWLYSATKVFTNCAVLQLIERGELNLDDPVGAILPAYAHLTVREGQALRPAVRTLTLRHLMSMQSGLDYDMDTPTPRALLQKQGGHATTRQLVDARAGDPLCFEPGTDFFYSLSHDVLAAVIEEVSGLRFSEYLKQNIFDPLKLRCVGFFPDAAVLDRMCAQYTFDEASGRAVPCAKADNSYRFSPEYESGGAGLYGDVDSYIAFADALACGGVGKNGARILSPEMIQLWSANQLGPRARASFDTWGREGYSYALGVRTRVAIFPGSRGQIGEFGWDGAAGAWTMIDPIHRLSAFFAMHMRDFAYCYDVIHPRLRDLIYEGLEL